MSKRSRYTGPSPETQGEALKIAKGMQRPGQTKEQTKLIVQGKRNSSVQRCGRWIGVRNNQRLGRRADRAIVREEEGADVLAWCRFIVSTFVAPEGGSGRSDFCEDW